MALVRVKTARAKESVVLKHPVTGAWEPVAEGDAYKSTDPLVRKFPKAFVIDNDNEE